MTAEDGVVVHPPGESFVCPRVTIIDITPTAGVEAGQRVVADLTSATWLSPDPTDHGVAALVLHCPPDVHAGWRLVPPPQEDDLDEEPAPSTGRSPVDEERLRSTTDAAVWADEFAKLRPLVGRGTLITWFANAIEQGRIAGTERAVESAASSTLAERLIGQRGLDGAVDYVAAHAAALRRVKIDRVLLDVLSRLAPEDRTPYDEPSDLDEIGDVPAGAAMAIGYLYGLVRADGSDDALIDQMPPAARAVLGLPEIAPAQPAASHPIVAGMVKTMLGVVGPPTVVPGLRVVDPDPAAGLGLVDEDDGSDDAWHEDAADARLDDLAARIEEPAPPPVDPDADALARIAEIVRHDGPTTMLGSRTWATQIDQIRHIIADQRSTP